MSARGRKFLQAWLSDNIPEGAKPDSVLAGELADRLLYEAEHAGLTEEEIDEEADGVFQTAMRALKRRDRS
ncbi:hypothetical protein [Mesorhizobium sp. IMUNJ 23232]|uniref:DUF768 domain-containing protein n=1 Tax=Mesorhizobium sp. IMUNJ 23232 TaxID=3376064 RepID=UPI0037B9E7CF